MFEVTLKIGVTILFVIWVAANPSTATASEEENENTGVDKKDLSDTNIAFDLPDLTATVETTTGTYQLEAYKSVNNDQIIRDVSTGQTTAFDKVTQLLWVSVGQPTFVKTSLPSEPNVDRFFHATSFGFVTYVQMLTPPHRSILSATAQRKYRVNVTDSQIVNFVLSKFQCSIVMRNEVGDKYLMTGDVFDFRHFPLRMNFEAPPRSIERKLFHDMVHNATDLDFMCNMASTGKLAKTNTLTITAQQQQLIGMEEKLFGQSSANSSSNVYVTRDQMTELSSEMYTSLNIVEDYQMSEGQFSDAFVEGMINQIATEQFKQVPIDTVLASLSKYGFDIGQDIKPDVIKRDMGSIMTIEKKDDKSRIILDEKNYNKIEQSSSASGKAGAKVPFVSASVEWANKNSKSSITETALLNDQLRELNTMSQKETQWDIEGDRVVPKSMNVARLARIKLGKTLSFSRIRVQTFSAPFDRKFAIHTYRAAASAAFLDKLSSRVSTLEADLRKKEINFTSKIENLEADFQDRDYNISTYIEILSNLTDMQLQVLNKSLVRVQSLASTTDRYLWQLWYQAVRRCQICFWESQGSKKQCSGNRHSCSSWSGNFNGGYNIAGDWNQPFHDNTDNARGGCTYRWKINCMN